MEKQFLLIITLFLTILIHAQEKSTTSKFNYQAVVRNNSGQILANQNISFRISILEGSASGVVVFQEEHTSLITNDFGLANLEIGGGTPVIGTMDSPDWGNNDYFIQIELDENGGTSYQIMGVSQLLQVPYAIHAEEAETVTNENQQLSLSGNDLTISGTGGNTVTIPNELPTGANGNMLMHDGSDWNTSSILFHDSNKIGLATTSPLARLDILGSSSLPGLRVENSSSIDGSIAIKTDGYFNTNGYLGVMGADNFDGITGLMLDNHRIGVLGYSESSIGYGTYGMAKKYGGYFTNSSTGVTSNVGIAGANAALEVEGGAVFGTETNAVKIMDVIEITGTTDNLDYTAIPYPTGWNETNCRMIYSAIQTSSGNWVLNGFWADYTSTLGYIFYVNCVTNGSNGYRLMHPYQTEFTNKPYRIILMKVE